MTIKRFYHSLRLLLIRSEIKRAEYLKAKKILGGIGENCRWGPWLLPLYPELIKLHDNVLIHKTAHLVPHDMMNNFLMRCYPDVDFGSKEVLGPIEIHDNVYISMYASIMPGVEIGKNSIVSAGSIVSDDVPENSIVAGNPAKVVGKFSAYVALRRMNARNNKKFPNQHLPADIAEFAWEQFERKHQNPDK